MTTSHETQVARAGLFSLGALSSPTTPAVNATTFVARSLGDLAPVSESSLLRITEAHPDTLYYGVVDTPTTLHLAKRVASLEHGSSAVLSPSGQAAVFLAISALVVPGDHILVVDTVIYSTKWLFDRHFRRMGILVEYVCPSDISVISEKLRPNTRALFMEVPGAFTYELVDVDAVVELCRRNKIATIVDNTWAASTFFHPLDHGVDLSIISLGKSLGGLAGVSLGAVVSARHELHRDIKCEAALLGFHVSSEACSAALMSITTLTSRLSQQMRSTDEILERLGTMQNVSRIVHPSLSKSNDRRLFERYFSGYNSLISVEFDMPSTELEAGINRLRLINIGYGWGGAISLVTKFNRNDARDATPGDAESSWARFYIGLESASEIADDMSKAFRCG